MKLLIQISGAHHELLLSQLIDESALYSTLMNAVKIDGLDGIGASKFIDFICDTEQAQRHL